MAFFSFALDMVFDVYISQALLPYDVSSEFQLPLFEFKFLHVCTFVLRIVPEDVKAVLIINVPAQPDVDRIVRVNGRILVFFPPH